jgi:hypothetical protein
VWFYILALENINTHRFFILLRNTSEYTYHYSDASIEMKADVSNAFQEIQFIIFHLAKNLFCSNPLHPLTLIGRQNYGLCLSLSVYGSSVWWECNVMFRPLHPHTLYSKSPAVISRIRLHSIEHDWAYFHNYCWLTKAYLHNSLPLYMDFIDRAC